MEVVPAAIQPSRAHKTVSDLGVLGLEACKSALNEKYGPPVPTPVTTLSKDDENFTASNWGKESEEERERKAHLVRTSRARQIDNFAMARKVGMLLLRVLVLQKILRSALAGLLGEHRATQVVWGALAVVGYLKFRAKPLANDKWRSPLMRLPFLGSLLQMAFNKSRFHNYLSESIRSEGYVTAEITIPGGEFMAIMDARDREYVLKTNFRNYLKNRENDMGSFEYVLGDVTGRGIFSTDKFEWQDSRKIASHMFSGASLKAKMEDVFNHHADMVVDMLERKYAGSGKPVDMQEIFQSAIFDAFCEIAFGHFPNATQSAMEGKKPPFLVAFDTCQTVATERFLMTPLVWHLERMFGALTGLGKEGAFARSAQVLEDYVRPIIDQRLKDVDVNSKSDLLSLYIKHARDTKQAHMLDPTYLRDTIINCESSNAPF
jgi:cytochrome P450